MGGLFNLYDIDVLNWWHEVINDLQTYREEELKKIGDLGEWLTLEFEKNRIANDGVAHSDTLVLWVAKITDEYGFDIKSIDGSFFGNIPDASSKIQIEVKASEKAYVNNFALYVTENEWKVAKRNLNSYYFYLWVGVDTNTKSAKYGPYVIPARHIIDKFPNNVFSGFDWIKTRISMNINDYAFLPLSSKPMFATED